MKKFLNVLLIIFCIISSILSLVFIVIEARLLVSLDWSIYDNAFNGMIRYLFRLLLSLFVLLVSISNIISIKIKKTPFEVLLMFSNLALFISSIIISLFASNFVGLVCILLSFIILSIKTAKIFIK